MNEVISKTTGYLTIVCMFAMIVFTIWVITRVIKKKNWKAPLKLMGYNFILIIIFTIVGSYAYSKTDNYKDFLIQQEDEKQKKAEQKKAEQEKEDRKEEIKKEEEWKKESEEEGINTIIEIEEKETIQKLETEKTTNGSEESASEKGISEMSEEEYKEMCKELWHDDVFFSEENLKGTHVKLEIYVEEWKYFKTYVDQTTQDFINEHNLQRNLLACGVSRGEPNSYVGGQINVYFSNDYEYQQSDYETGKELIIYGEIVDYSRNTWRGYNVCGIMPIYIEEK